MDSTKIPTQINVMSADIVKGFNQSSVTFKLWNQYPVTDELRTFFDALFKKNGDDGWTATPVVLGMHLYFDGIRRYIQFVEKVSTCVKSSDASKFIEDLLRTQFIHSGFKESSIALDPFQLEPMTLSLKVISTDDLEELNEKYSDDVILLAFHLVQLMYRLTTVIDTKVIAMDTLEVAPTTVHLKLRCNARKGKGNHLIVIFILMILIAWAMYGRVIIPQNEVKALGP